MKFNMVPMSFADCVYSFKFPQLKLEEKQNSALTIWKTLLDWRNRFEMCCERFTDFVKPVATKKIAISQYRLSFFSLSCARTESEWSRTKEQRAWAGEKAHPTKLVWLQFYAELHIYYNISFGIWEKQRRTDEKSR